MKKQFPQTLAAFSLVEIAMALGLAAFGIISLMGVLRLAIESDETAGRDTRFATMTRQVMSEMRSAPFDALWTETPSENAGVAPSMGDPVPSKYYFNSEGVPLSPSDAQAGNDALYVCVVTKIPDEYTKNADGTMYNQLRAELVFRWPMRAPETAQKKTTPLYVNIARF